VQHLSGQLLDMLAASVARMPLMFVEALFLWLGVL
jgi:hypothetical protein